MIKEKIRTVADYPKKGILFRDITPLLQDPAGFKSTINQFVNRFEHPEYQFDYVIGIEARGFVIGSAIAYALGKGFIPIRKPGKLPAKIISEHYQLEYSTDSLEIHQDAINPGDRVILIDDLLATGGTALAAASLIKQLGGEIIECAFLINLPALGGHQRLRAQNHSVYFLAEY